MKKLVIAVLAVLNISYRRAAEKCGNGNMKRLLLFLPALIMSLTLQAMEPENNPQAAALPNRQVPAASIGAANDNPTTHQVAPEHVVMHQQAHENQPPVTNNIVPAGPAETGKQKVKTPLSISLTEDVCDRIAPHVLKLYDAVLERIKDPKQSDYEKAFVRVTTFLQKMPTEVREEIFCRIINDLNRPDIVAHHLLYLFDEMARKGLGKNALRKWTLRQLYAEFKKYCEDGQIKVFTYLADQKQPRADFLFKLLLLFNESQLSQLSAALVPKYATQDTQFYQQLYAKIKTLLRSFYKKTHTNEILIVCSPEIRKTANELMDIYNEEHWLFVALMQRFDRVVETFNEAEQRDFFNYLLLEYGSQSILNARKVACTLSGYINFLDFEGVRKWINVVNRFVSHYPETVELLSHAEAREEDARVIILHSLRDALAQRYATHCMIKLLTHIALVPKYMKNVKELLAELPDFVRYQVVHNFFEKARLNQVVCTNIEEHRDCPAFEELPDAHKHFYFENIIACLLPHFLKREEITYSDFGNFVFKVMKSHKDLKIIGNIFEMVLKELRKFVMTPEMYNYQQDLIRQYKAVQKSDKSEEANPVRAQ